MNGSALTAGEPAQITVDHHQPHGGGNPARGGTLSATASDPSGVTRVEFYAGTRLLGTDTTDPYGQLWQDDQIYWGRVSWADGAPFATGRRVQVDVGVEVNSTTNESVDLFYASDANAPSWTYVTTVRGTALGFQASRRMTFSRPGVSRWCAPPCGMTRSTSRPAPAAPWTSTTICRRAPTR
ncbi:Ig-like domain-containing protein [Hyalangium minutum]|uniref:Ig-like domain-containing protein n=1 Tax=Hyalangium minutum TaxID=394096 RepID=UPI0012F96D8B|nr:Ig-like domain-containing protein [Hyalangium minutum]